MDSTRSSEGYLIVRVSAGSGTLPIEGATVYITPYENASTGGDLLYTLKTDSSGLTPKVSLSAPSGLESLSPGESDKPYSEYVLTVVKDGYNSVENIGIPIFDGITSVQGVEMVPLTAFERASGEVGMTTYYENDLYTNLRGNGDLPVQTEGGESV